MLASALESMREGNSSRQGGHQLAQKLRTTTLPWLWYWRRLTVCAPSRMTMAGRVRRPGRGGWCGCSPGAGDRRQETGDRETAWQRVACRGERLEMAASKFAGVGTAMGEQAEHVSYIMKSL